MGIRVQYTGGPTKRKKSIDVEVRPAGTFQFTKGEVVDLHAPVARRLLSERPDEFERVMPDAAPYAAAPSLRALPVTNDVGFPEVSIPEPLGPLPNNELVPGETIRMTRAEAERLQALYPGGFDVVEVP